MYNQTVFGSIGFASGAAVGSFVAGRELGTIKRGILVTGEGSLQLTVQAFSDLLRHEVNATVYVCKPFARRRTDIYTGSC
jgi:pyruvate decarboxylase